MAPRTIGTGRVILSLSLLSLALTLSNCQTGGDHSLHKYGFPVPGDHLVYVTPPGPIADVTVVHATGNPKATGDQLAWVSVDGTKIVSVTIPDPNAPASTPPCPAPSWNPYLAKESSPSGDTVISGALNLAGLPAGNGSWCVPYSVRLQGVVPPIYGRIMIVKP